MLVLPAVDIKDGACVRLRQGKAEETTVFAADPVAAARAWEAQGAQYLHVIDLDGAFDGAPVNKDLIRDICSHLNIPVELFTPIFAVARMAGWSAHRMEELVNAGKIIRPAYESVAARRDYVAMKDRK